jgi:hypothetical protein
VFVCLVLDDGAVFFQQKPESPVKVTEVLSAVVNKQPGGLHSGNQLLLLYIGQLLVLIVLRVADWIWTVPGSDHSTARPRLEIVQNGDFNPIKN